jgi:hypothetical protein
VILLTAYLLATVDDWIHPDTIITEQGDAGTKMLRDLGIHDITTLVRAPLIDHINRAAHHAEVGLAVDTVARAWRTYQQTTRHGDTSGGEARHQQATGALIEARAHYARLRADARSDSTLRTPASPSRPMPVCEASTSTPLCDLGETRCARVSATERDRTVREK